MSTKILLNDGSGAVKGSVFYDSAADEIRIASHDSNNPSHIDGYIAVSSAGLTSSNIALDTGAVTSGTWTPTTTAGSNLDGDPSVSLSMYHRIGDIVSFAIRFGVDPTAGGNYEFNASLPIASDFASSVQAQGAGSGSISTNVRVSSDSSNDELTISGTSSSGSAHALYVTGMYQVIA